MGKIVGMNGGCGSGTGSNAGLARDDGAEAGTLDVIFDVGATKAADS